MALHFLRHKRRRAPSVIIVSLIDVLLVVLIFLMVTTTFKQNFPSLKLALPQAQAAKASGPATNKTFTVAVTTNFPFFYVQNRPVTLDALRKELEAAAKKDSQLKVEIKADQKSPWGEVLKVIDTAKTANVGSINAITARPGTPAPVKARK